MPEADTLSEGNLRQIQLNGYDLEHKHFLIKGPTADNVYQSTSQPLGSKEQSVELRNRFASSPTSGEEF